MSDAHRCDRCGKDEENHFTEPTKTRLAENLRCFGCDFWEGYERTQDDPTHVIAKGWHYVVGNENGSKHQSCRGHGGARFNIAFNDGREVTSTNVWCQGEIPERFRETMPDNATIKP